jgi:hypothetical protein
MRRGRRAALSTFTLGPLDFLDDQPQRLIEGGAARPRVVCPNRAHSSLITRFSISIAILQPFFNGKDGRREAEDPPTTLECTRQKPIH